MKNSRLLSNQMVLANRPGFTLFELIVVMVILVILASVAVPMMAPLFAPVRLDAAADQIRGAWAQARSHAIEESQAYRFSIMHNQPKYRVAPEASESGAQDASSNPPGSITHEDHLPSEIQFQMNHSGAISSGWTPIATFLPDGTCLQDVEITLTEANHPGIKLKIRGMTGAITVEKLKKGQK